MRIVLALAAKDLRLLMQDRGGVFFTFVFPLLYAIFIGAIFSQAAGDYKGRRVPTPVVDEDRSTESLALIESLKLRDEIALEPMQREDALRLVRQGRKPVCLILPQGFGRQSGRRLADGAPAVELASDPARQGEAGIVKATLAQAMLTRLRDELGNPSALSRQLAAIETGREEGEENLRRTTQENQAEVRATTQESDAEAWAGGGLAAAAARLDGATLERALRGLEPVRFENVDVGVTRDRPRNLYAVSFPQGVMWGAIGCTAAFGVALVMERVRGTLRRIRTTPASAAQILAGKALACMAVNLAVGLLLLTMAWAAFGVRPNSVPLVVLAMVCTAMAFVGIMLLLSTFGQTEHGAATIFWGVLTLLAMVGGAMVPELLMPPFLRAIGTLSPVRWGIRAIEGGLWREMSLVELMPALGGLALLGLVCFLAATRLARWTRA